MPSEKVAIERKDLQEKLKKFLDLEGYQPNPLTRVVFGPRGSGKTAAVINILNGRKGVVYVHIRDSDDTYLVKQILRALSVSVPQWADPTSLLGGALQDIQKKRITWLDRILIPSSIRQDPGDSQPILVVDFNPRMDDKSFDNMLLLLKSWGSDSGWVKPIVILTATLGLHRPRLELRTEFFKIEDLNNEECDLYHQKLCNNLKIDKRKIFEILPPDRWNRFLPLNALAQNNISSLNDLEEAAIKLEREQTEIYENALISFTKEMEKKKYSGEHRVLCKLMNKEKVYLKEFCNQYGLSEKDIIDSLLTIRPRPFYIHPQTREVYIGSRFMMPALERMCTPESTST